MTNLLEVKNLKINFSTYEGVAQVVNNINFKVKEEEIVSLVGESGCGKSVTIRSIMDLLPAAEYPEGEITFLDKNLMNLSNSQWKEIRGKGISMIFQDPMNSLNPVFKIKTQMTNVYFYQGKNHDFGFNSRKQKRKAYDYCLSLLKKMRIPDPDSVMEMYPSELSGGMSQRVNIALALIHKPKLLLADEPGTALDVSVQDDILQELKRLVKEEGMSMIYITHDLGVAREISDRIYVMYAGTIVEESVGPIIFDNPLHPYTEGLLDSIPKLNKEMGEGIEGTIPSFTTPPTGCRYYSRCKYRMDICKTKAPDLVEQNKKQKVACYLYE